MLSGGAKELFAIEQILRYYRPLVFFGALSMLFGVGGLVAGLPGRRSSKTRSRGITLTTYRWRSWQWTLAVKPARMAAPAPRSEALLSAARSH